MPSYRKLALFTLLLFLFAPSSFGQTAAGGESILMIGGEVERPLKLTAVDLAKLPRRLAEAKDHGGKPGKFEGILLGDVLKLAGVSFGESLRGKRLATYLLVEATDGYQAVFALPEPDPAFTDKVVLLATYRDGKLLPGNDGPLRLIVPDEKRHGRWVRQVKSLTILRASQE